MKAERSCCVVQKIRLICGLITLYVYFGKKIKLENCSILDN